jgi:CubicO group peptidase (beta-lactamase class C family)
MFLFCFFVIIPFIFGQSGESLDALHKKVDDLFARWDKPDSPGCALGVIKDGRFVYRRGYGMANLEYGIPISSKSVFRIGSTSKQFTAMCIALLEEEGKLAVDDNIRKYFPEMPAYAEEISIRNLLHHTSGIRDYLTLWMLAGARGDDYFIDPEVVQMLARQKELNFVPGEEFLYSNSGYFLLSEIVKRVTGNSMRVYAQENIFKPLGMENTHFHDDHREIVENRASGYSPRRKGIFSISMTTLGMIGDGGVFTCVDDLLRWNQNFYNNTLGKGGSELIAKVLAPGRLNNGNKLDYAWGLMVNEYKGLKLVSHGGAFVGFRADMLRFPDQKFSVICLSNLSTFDPSRLARKVADIYLADLIKEKEESPSSKETQAVKLSKEELTEKKGIYTNPETGSVWKITPGKETLTVNTNRLRFTLMPLSRFRFYAKRGSLDLKVEFRKQEGGKPLLLQLDQAGEEPEILEAVEFIPPSPAQLKEYTGKYFSEELQVSYILFLQKGKLYLRHENPHMDYPKRPLEPFFHDLFRVSGRTLIFSRDDIGEPVEFKINAGRVQNISFVKIK